MDIFDYLDWRGDLSFARDSLNEVDSLILSVLAYLDLDGIAPACVTGTPVPLSVVGEKVKRDGEVASILDTFFARVPDLLHKAANTVRFRDTGVHGYVNQVDFENTKQFSAVVFSLGQGDHFIAFRGTDDTLAGWKEDFQMSFMDEILSQKQAVTYLDDVAKSIGGPIYLGGHSKGGNLAVYAAAHAAPQVQDRIAAIYSNDGPGFRSDVIESPGYKIVLDRLDTFVPKSSCVGILLEHGEAYKVVSSSESGLMQHNPLSWEVRGRGFVYEKEITRACQNFDSTLRSWLHLLTAEQKALFVDALFDLLHASGAQTISELSKEKLAATQAIIKTLRHMEPSTRTLLGKTIAAFFKESRKVLKASIEADIGLLLSRRPHRSR